MNDQDLKVEATRWSKKPPFGLKSEQLACLRAFINKLSKQKLTQT